MSSAIVNQQMIAERLSISVATVSKALRNQPGVSSELRERIAKAANELGYRRGRSRAGRAPARRSVMVAALIRQPLDHGTGRLPEYMDGLCEAASEYNASMIVQTYSYKVPVDRLFLNPAMQPPALREGKVQGILIGGEWPLEIVAQLAQKHPCICFPNDLEVDVDVVGLNVMRTSLQLVRHLIKLGHDRIGFLGRCDAFAWAGERFAGYVGALSKSGLTYDPRCVIDVDAVPLMQEGHEAYWKKVIEQVDAQRRAGVRAWMCSSDWPGYQLFRGMLDRDVRVPQDISIIGFDDSEPVTLGCPPLTSVRIPRDVMGGAAMRRLLIRIDNPELPVQQTLFPGIFIDHQTAGPAADVA